MATNKQKLTRAVEELSRVNGLYTLKNLTANLPTGITGQNSSDTQQPLVNL